MKNMTILKTALICRHSVLDNAKRITVTAIMIRRILVSYVIALVTHQSRKKISLVLPDSRWIHVPLSV